MNYKEQVEEFLEVIHEDFYLDLGRYMHYPDIEFNTKDLSITTLLKIAEASLYKQHKSKVIHNIIDFKHIMNLVLDRIDNCGDVVLAAEASAIVRELDSYDYANPPYQPEPNTTPLNINEYSREYVSSMKDTIMDEKEKARISTYL